MPLPNLSSQKLLRQFRMPGTHILYYIILSSFAGDGRFIISRDYLTLKVWDTHMESRPIKVVNINESLRSMLCELYESDFIFDKFEIALAPRGDRILTGGYG
jgi:serine/threonine-protein phosphatase 2A regulatory subunit B